MTIENSIPTVLGGMALVAAVKSTARRLGFDLVGIAPAEPSRYREYFRRWLDEGQAGSMGYLAHRFGQRSDPREYFPGAASAICLAMNYHVPLEKTGGEAGPLGRIARYALGDDYHELMMGRLRALADWLRQAAPQAGTRCAVDTAPVMEKELAARAGIGWMGKNTCLIHEKIGSWLVLGEILTTLDLPPDEAGIDRCGSCRACLDACPTQAITGPYTIDARRCISYLTIEHRGEIDQGLAEKVGNWIYGCDICQEVCPWNRRAPTASEAKLAPRFPAATVDLEEMLAWTQEDYRKNLRHSAMKRVKLPMLKRNAEIAKENQARMTKPETRIKSE